MEGGKYERNTHQEVHALYYVKEPFVFPVSDAFRPPRDCIRNRHRWSDLDLEFVGFLGNVPGVSLRCQPKCYQGDRSIGAHSCKILLSVVCGNPKSIISSISSYMITKLSRMD